MTIQPDKLKRLAQLLGMIGSTHDGEALNAARAAQRLLGSLSLTWEEVLSNETTQGYPEEFVRKVAQEAYAQGLQDGRTQATPKPRASYSGYARMILANFPDILSDWETGFLDSWTEKRYPPTEKQIAIFKRIAQKTGQPIPQTIAWIDTQDDEPEDEDY